MRQRCLRGVTLPELMVSITVMALIFGVIVAVTIAAMRVWYRCSSFSQAFPPAYQVITRLNQELKNAYYIQVSADQHAITFRLPQTDANGINIIPFQQGREIAYYLSDSTGNPLVPGTDLWRRETIGTSETPFKRIIARNVSDLEFNCDATQAGRVFAVYSTAITIIGAEKATRYESEFRTAMAIRNPTGE